MCIGVLPVCMSVHHVCPMTAETKEGTGVTDSYEPSCGLGGLNPGPLEEPVLLTAESSFQSPSYC